MVSILEEIQSSMAAFLCGRKRSKGVMPLKWVIGIILFLVALAVIIWLIIRAKGSSATGLGEMNDILDRFMP